MAQMMDERDFTMWGVTPLAAYLRAAAGKRFCWGGWAKRSHDCCTFAWDWVRERTGVDAMADLRGRYRTADEAVALLRASGCDTLEHAVRIGAARAGLEVTETPRLGDVGLVEVDPRPWDVGVWEMDKSAREAAIFCILCIRMDHAWAAPGLRGIAETRAPALICWRVP